jgi:hypothetical protein
MLTPFLSEIDARRRPQLNFDEDGRASFATATDDFYINLTVDSANRLTWYAVVRGAEYFAESVAFDGRKVPAELRTIFAM